SVARCSRRRAMYRSCIIEWSSPRQKQLKDVHSATKPAFPGRPPGFLASICERCKHMEPIETDKPLNQTPEIPSKERIATKHACIPAEPDRIPRGVQAFPTQTGAFDVWTGGGISL